MQVFTDGLLKTAPVPKTGKRSQLVDSRCTGLCFRVTDQGIRTFSFRFRCPTTGRVTRMLLGRYPDLALAKARQKADALRVDVANGLNPAEERRRLKETSASRSFGAIADRYLEEHAKRNKAASSAEQDERNLKLHVLPKLKNRHAGTIRRGDIIKISEGLIAASKPVLANRVQALISKIFSFALDADLITSNPCVRLKKRGAERAIDRVLSDDEIRLFWPRALASPMSPRTGFAVRLILLTGVRPGEAAGMCRAELENLEGETPTWLLPKERTKNRRPHLVPLTPAAVQIIRAALELIDSTQEFVFASPKSPEKPIEAHSLTVAMDRFGGKKKGRDKSASNTEHKLTGVGADTWKAKPPTPHDFRRTVETRLAALGVSKEIRDRILNHVQGDVGTKHYNQYDFQNEKRAALESWSAALADILSKSAAK